jgi:hypothetical protein
LIIRAGYDIAFDCYQEVPMVVLLSVLIPLDVAHHSGMISPSVPI